MEKKVYGVYSGSIENLKEIDKLSEVELFLAISSLDNYILKYKRIQAYNMIRGLDITEDEFALEYLINKTKNFGVELEKDKEGRVIKTGDYAGWYEYFAKYFNKVLSKEEFRKFIELKSKGYNVSQYLPQESYLDYKKSKEEQAKKAFMKIPV